MTTNHVVAYLLEIGVTAEDLKVPADPILKSRIETCYREIAPPQLPQSPGPTPQ